MKNFKIVFASLLIAAMGVVGFSSFTTAKKVVDDKTYIYDGTGPVSLASNWFEAAPSGCDGEDQLCALTFDEADVDLQDAINAAIGHESSPSVNVGEFVVLIESKDTTP